MMTKLLLVLASVSLLAPLSCRTRPGRVAIGIALTVDKGDTAISNAPIISDTPAGDTKHRIQFATTTRLSTYLVAMLVGDFQCAQRC